MTPAAATVTALLHDYQRGDRAALDRLMDVVYQELRAVSAGLVGRERAEHAPQTTELIHEAYLRLCAADVFARAPNRAFFYAAAARAMRQVLVDHARARKALKRGGGQTPLPLDSLVECLEQRCSSLPDLHEALGALAALDERQARVVELRFFGGHTAEEVAELLGVSLSTVEGDFRKARAFLHGRLVPFEGPR